MKNEPDTSRRIIGAITAIVIGLALGFLIKRVHIGLLIGLLIGIAAMGLMRRRKQ